MKTLLMLLSLMLSACVAAPPIGSFTINGLIFKNSGQSDILNVRLTVQQIHRFIACDNIVAGGVCATEFPTRQYNAEELTIAWTTDRGGFYTRENVIVGRPLSNSAHAATIYVDLLDNGAMTVSFINR
jgi:hypothetical protein